ncbi:peptidoglycan D,D-transpeptidase FtsI family protein [cyanobacterium endosymbiont of Rhopalodia gibberula]|uniref:peptidoglycan D,D-transpeptidase FtsI family protein n=1 Tax=cyanobacterium endosymbiont of Rhopalodia gibberula TaxID=1763363 RepID=UPI000E65DB63|nr:penicillin-binding protein 2 [cyanobacterium endosymbiont of Rhopalodia gibberula]
MSRSNFKRFSSRSKYPDKKSRFHRKSDSSNGRLRRSLPASGSKKRTALPQLRLLLVWGVLIGAMIGLGVKLYQLQIVQAPELQKKARSQQTVNLRPYIPRRSIIDSQGTVLATDRLAHILYVHPIQFKITKEEIAAKLSPILEDKTPQQLIERFKQRDTGIPIARGLTEGQAARIEKLRLDGVELNESYIRFYPQEKMVSEVIGYVDSDRNGQAGIERSQEKLLERDLLSLYVRRTALGEIVPAFLPQDLLKSNDLRVQLTLDMRIQRAARVALQQQLNKFNAKRGAVIIMDSTDGSLISLVCEPTFDPNKYYKSRIELFKNWTVTDLYEPGSTFKPINVALALTAGVIQPNTIIYDSGAVQVDGWNIYNATRTGHGAINIAQILQTSSNVAMVHMMRRLSRKDYYQGLQQLQVNKKTGIDLPGEVSGYLKSEEIFTKRGIEVATASFGQGLSLTPIKLVQLHGALANGGKLVTPHIVRGLVDVDGHLHWKPKHKVTQIMSPHVSRQVAEMMETVVTDGSGKASQILGYRIGGKTGTAQKAGPGGGYLPSAKITSFVAILPVDNPRYVVMTVVDEPQGANTYGSTVAAPIAKKVIEALIFLKGIPPSQHN